VPELRNVVSKIKERKEDRLYFYDFDAIRRLKTFGTCLLEEVSQTQLFTSLLPKRFRDWSNFSAFGIRPEDNWAGYEGEYTKETILKLPWRNSMGYSNDLVYFNSLHAYPAPELYSMRLTAVNYIVIKKPVETVQGADIIADIGNYTVAKIKDPLPRAFAIPVLDEYALKRFQNDLHPAIENQILSYPNVKIPYKKLAIQSYEREKVTLSVDLLEE
jgi:hypothetical protein